MGDTARRGERTPLWRDLRVLRVAVQIVFLLVLASFVWYLGRNLTTNLAASGIEPPNDFSYLTQPAGFTILGEEFRPSQSFRQALLIGIKNTALVSVVGIVLATVLGTLVGMGRLSSNWLVRKSTAAYVEGLRNTPILLLIIFVYLAVILRLPPMDEAVDLGFLQFSNQGLWVPWLDSTRDLTAFWGVVGLGVVLAVLLGVWLTRRFNLTGQPHHRVLFGLGTVLLVAAVGYALLGRPLEISLPSGSGRDVEGGLRLIPEYGALLFALTIYTASHIAEIVRGSILSVPKGQREAATAVGLTPSQRYRHVILPQAMRVAIPPMANQYLNLTKNSSLAVAIGFPEVTRLTSLMLQQVPAVQAIALLMLIYLSFSLSISAVTNVINRRLAIKER